MFVEKFGDTRVLLQLQQALADYGLRNVAISLSILGMVILAMDYAYMIYLHLKMVRIVYEDCKRHLDRPQNSHLVHFPHPLLGTLIYSPRTSHGYISKKSPKISKLPSLHSGLVETQPYGFVMRGLLRRFWIRGQVSMRLDREWLCSGS
jgi:hypothetical protein